MIATPPALTLEIEFDPALPEDRAALYRNAVAGPEAKTLVVYDEPFWRADGFSGQASEPGAASEVTIDASPMSGAPGVLASFTFGPVAEKMHALDPGERRAAVLASLVRRFGSARGFAVGLRRDRVVDRRVDPRLLDGALTRPGSSRATGTCCGSPGTASTGPAPRPRRSRTVRSTVRFVRASAPRPRCSPPTSASTCRPPGRGSD